MIKSAPYYWLDCDGCGTRCEYGEFSALYSQDEAVDLAIDYDWTTDGQRHHCPTCPTLDGGGNPCTLTGEDTEDA